MAKLQCEGTYDNYASADFRDVAVRGMYVEIAGDRIKVQGTAGFDGNYTIINRRDDGIGFQLQSNPSYSGFLNRFSGRLSLMEKGEPQTDGSFKLKQLLNAVCTRAKSLF